MISANLGTVTKAVTIAVGLSPTRPSTVTSHLRLRCDQPQIAAGKTAVCEVTYAPSDAADAAGFSVSSTSERVKTPATVDGRAGRSAVRFEVSADEEASQENVTIEARAGSSRAQASLLLVPSGTLHVRVPRSVTATPGSPVHFVAAATDEQDLPLSLSVAGMPEGARFDLATGLYEWTPTDRDLGSSKISFSARNSLNSAVTKTVTVNVVSREPVLTELRNGAGSGAVAACSPGALGALVGTSLAGTNSTDAVRVLINGSEAPVTQVTDEQVRFVCPALAPGTEMGMAVEVGGHRSNELRTVMQQTAPGLFSVDGTGTGQGIAMHALGLAALPGFARAGMPAAAGDEITVLATGIDCGEIAGAPQPLLYFGHSAQRITMLKASTMPGVCEVHAVIPGGVSGDRVGLYLESVREDGMAVRSNTLLVAIEE